jgi:hypothetical protein
MPTARAIAHVELRKPAGWSESSRTVLLAVSEKRASSAGPILPLQLNFRSFEVIPESHHKSGWCEKQRQSVLGSSLTMIDIRRFLMGENTFFNVVERLKLCHRDDDQKLAVARP